MMPDDAATPLRTASTAEKANIEDVHSPILTASEKSKTGSDREGTQKPPKFSKLSFLDGLTPKGELNACICFALVVLNVYLTYVAVFSRSFIDPFNSYANETTSTDDVITGNDYPTAILSVVIIVVVGIVMGYLAAKVLLPGLLGMLIIGILLRNIPLTGQLLQVPVPWSIFLRRTAFIVILLRGGLSLDAQSLIKLKGACMRLCFIPCSVEALVVAVSAYFILGLDILFGFTMGFILAAVSPAVIVPAMVDAQAKGYGVEAGIPTLVVAAASLDDVYAITMFSIFISVIFGTGGSPWLTVIRAPVEVISGVFFGTLFGLILAYFPSRDQKNVNFLRVLLLFTMATTLLFGTSALEVDSIGAIAVLIMAFVAGQLWKQQQQDDTSLPQEDYLAVAWNLFFQPCLFGLIGFELSLDMLTLKTTLLCLLVLLIGVLFRTLASFLAVSGAGFNLKERIYVGLAWLPKATVQAALAPVALDLARSREDLPQSYLSSSTLLLTIAVISILTTAPIGAFLIRLATPRLLKKT